MGELEIASILTKSLKTILKRYQYTQATQYSQIFGEHSYTSLIFIHFSQLPGMHATIRM